ncbi:preprotein translocase subunit YajC [Wolbachia endosymbiont of Ctenocephalides felis wCfeT]|uniref:preprotein translocase subunit YajC n=1 Tax=Wolbachia endosymbiont of Ctenocephalides felis wCfeT TaxID=2732593 RepID=UPI0014471A1E|nr:preprotein translocase subunit YajC [Wolbachia endosymbiont of Ctenocephalides felis wCfeT]
MFISEAFAAGAETSSAGASFASFIPLILIFVVFYFLIIRPQQKKLKEHRKLIDQIKRGDMVITSAGIIGSVNRVDETNAQFIVEIAPKVEVKILKSAISEVLSKDAQQVAMQPVEKNKIEKDKIIAENKKGKGNKSKNAA